MNFKTALIAFVIAASLPLAALAQTTPTVAPSGDGFGFGSESHLNDIAQQSGYNSSAEVPLEERISSIIAVVLSFLGVLFMVLMLYAGFNWMTAAGDEEKIKKAKDTIRAALIGLIIVIASYAASVFIIEQLWGTTSIDQ